MEKHADKQGLFMLHYLQSFNAADAARKAGYEPHNANVTGSTLLARDNVQQMLVEASRANLAPVEASLQDMTRLDLELAFSNITHLIEQTENGLSIKDLSGLDPSIQRTIQAIEDTSQGIRVRLHPKHPSIDRLTKGFELAGRDTGPSKQIETDQSRLSAAVSWLREAKVRWQAETVDELIERLEAELQPADAEIVG